MQRVEGAIGRPDVDGAVGAHHRRAEDALAGGYAPERAPVARRAHAAAPVLGGVAAKLGPRAAALERRPTRAATVVAGGGDRENATDDENTAHRRSIAVCAPRCPRLPAPVAESSRAPATARRTTPCAPPPRARTSDRCAPRARARRCTPSAWRRSIRTIAGSPGRCARPAPLAFWRPAA